MASDPSLDIDALLQPIPGDNPAGVDARETPAASEAYHELKDARAEARNAERRAFETIEDAAEASAALQRVAGEWRAVKDGACKLLAETTKDLEVAGWLTEALVRADGFRGLRDGLHVMHGLVENFWDGLYPPPEDEGAADVVAPIAGLNGVESEGPLLPPIRNIPLTDRQTGGYAFWHQRMAESGSTSFETTDIENALRGSGTPHLRAVYETLEEAQSALTELDRALTGKCGPDAPSLARIDEELSAIRSLLRRTVGERVAGDTAVGGAETADTESDGNGSGGTPAVETSVPGAIRTREEAFATLERVANFFQKTEPHSPMSYALSELVRRGRLSFPELLMELIPDQTSRWDVLTRMGIAPEKHDPEAHES